MQDGQYLQSYARALCFAAGHADDPADTAFLAATASATVAVEVELQAELLRAFDVDPSASAAVELSPSGLLYVNTMVGHAARGPFGIALCSVLACAWIYWAVGRALLERGSPDPRYRRWLEAYADPDYAASVQTLLDMADRAGAAAGLAERSRMSDVFAEGARLEWLFWDAAWREERWPIA